MSKELQPVEQLIPGGNINEYINGVFRIPILSQDEERVLLEDYFETNNIDSARKLILSHLRFVVYIARGYRGYGLQLADIIQEGNVGLMKALQRFDIKYNVRLTTFAVHWIKAEIHDFVLKNWRIVKIATTRAQRKLFFKLRSLKSTINWLNDDEVTKIAADLEVTEKDVREMEQRLASGDAAMESDKDSEEELNTSPILYLTDDRYEPSRLFEKSETEVNNTEDIHKAIEKLDERSRNIIKDRWLNDKKTPLRELSSKYGVSMERIRQIEETAFKNISGSLSHLKDQLSD